MSYSTLTLLLWSLLPDRSHTLTTTITSQQPSLTPMPTSMAAPTTSYSLSPISCSNITSCLEETHLQTVTTWGPNIVPNNDKKVLDQIASSITSLEAKWMSEAEGNDSLNPGTITSTAKATAPSCRNEADPDHKQASCVCSYSGSTRTFSTSQLSDASGRPCPPTVADKLFLPTSNAGPKTVTARPKYPFTTSFENGEVIACATWSPSLIATSTVQMCSGSSTTITPAPSPTVTLRLDGTPCNWGSASTTDIYTSISSVLVELCSKSAQPTVVTRSQNPFGTLTFTAQEETMTACNPKSMMIGGIRGIESDTIPRHVVEGHVVVTADRNMFYEANLETYINASANAITKSVEKNSVNMTVQSSGILERYDYNVTFSSANSTELNFYEFGYTEYTQAFSVDYKWEGGEGHSNGGELCEYASEIGNTIAMEVPELQELAIFTTEVCGIVFDVANDEDS